MLLRTQPNTAPYDLWPLAPGPLIGAAGAGPEPWRPSDDFLCAPRGSAADVGALQRTGPGSGPPLGSGVARPPCGSGPPPAAAFYTVTPCRLVDTRNPAGPQGGPALNAKSDRVFVLAGLCGIPAAARSLALNIAVIQPTSGPGFLTFYPAGTLLPLASTLNYPAGKIRANNAIVPLGPNGDVTVRCQQPSGAAHVVVDVTGYFQ